MIETIEHYRLERRLGAGAFATVWLAHDPILDGKVAIKVLAENWAADEGVRERFVSEARLMYRSSDPHFVRVLRAGELDSGQPYLVMEYADRGTLAERLRDPATRLTPAEAVELIDAVADCARAVHAHGFIHRDIKPSNVLITSKVVVGEAPEPIPPLRADERVLLADFGLAKDVAAASGFTRAGGSPVYMAPEQTRTNHMLDHRVDVHALGVTAFEILTGETPTDVSSGRSAELPLVSAVRPHLVAFDDVIARATATSPADRHDDVDAFMAELRQAVGGPSSADNIADGRAHSRAYDRADDGAGRSADGSTGGSTSARAGTGSEATGRRLGSRRVLVPAVVVVALVVGAAAGLVWRLSADSGTGTGTGTDADTQVAAPAADAGDGSAAAENEDSEADANASDGADLGGPDSGSASDGTEAESPADSEPELTPVDTSGIEDLCELIGRPAGSMAGQPGPAFCLLRTPPGELSAARDGENHWIDEFDVGLTEAEFNTAKYISFDFGPNRMTWWLDDDRVLLDMESGGDFGAGFLRPARPFFFENGRLVAEVDAAAGPSAIGDDRYALSQIVIAREPVGEAEIRAADDPSRAMYERHTIACSVDPRRIFSCELVGPGDRSGLDRGRIWRVSLDGPEGPSLPEDTPDAVVGNLLSHRVCGPTDGPDDCTNRYRVELTATAVRVEVNDALLFEQTGLPELPAELLEEPLLVYFVAHNTGMEPESVRFTWDRVAINPELASFAGGGS